MSAFKVGQRARRNPRIWKGGATPHNVGTIVRIEGERIFWVRDANKHGVACPFSGEMQPDTGTPHLASELQLIKD